MKARTTKSPIRTLTRLSGFRPAPSILNPPILNRLKPQCTPIPSPPPNPQRTQPPVHPQPQSIPNLVHPQSSLDSSLSAPPNLSPSPNPVWTHPSVQAPQDFDLDVDVGAMFDLTAGQARQLVVSHRRASW